jgi:3-mercaptopyruvate sulfurtransferase SseA
MEAQQARLEEQVPTVAPRQFVSQAAGSDGGCRTRTVWPARLGAHADPRCAQPERFRGENETLDPVGGHIPGAVNRFYFDNLDDAGCFFKPAAELRAEFAALLGSRPATQVVQQCGSGVTACHNLLAMELAGLSGSKLYPGSWSEWCADPARPVALG